MPFEIVKFFENKSTYAIYIFFENKSTFFENEYTYADGTVYKAVMAE